MSVTTQERIIILILVHTLIEIRNINAEIYSLPVGMDEEYYRNALQYFKNEHSNIISQWAEMFEFIGIKDPSAIEGIEEIIQSIKDEVKYMSELIENVGK